MKQTNWRHILSLAAGVPVSLFFLYMAFKGILLGQLFDAISQVELYWIPLFFACILLFFWLKAERWKYLLQPLKHTTTNEVFPSLVIGTAANYLLFAYLGELVRTYVFSRTSGLRPVSIFVTILLERIFDVICILLFAGIAFSLSTSLPWEMVYAGYVLSIVAVLALFATVLLAVKGEELLSFLPKNTGAAFLTYLEEGIKGLHSLNHPRLVIGIAATSLLQWAVMGAFTYLTIISVGIEAPLQSSFIAVALMAFGVILPSSPGHVGVIEFCFILSLKFFGVTREMALAAGIVYHVFLYVSVILAGMWYLHRFGLTLVHAKEEAENMDLTRKG